jgi:hypothetical protein
VSDTPIAEQLAAELGMAGLLGGRAEDHMEGQLDEPIGIGWFEDSELASETGVLANPHQGAVSRGPAEAAPAPTHRGDPDGQADA